MIEFELTYLAKSLPANLKSLANKKIIDLYIKNGTNHCDLRVRKSGDKYELTRKTPVKDNDASQQSEITIALNEVEFESLLAAKSRKIEKNRYYFDYGDKTAEFDVFEGDLTGLVLIDFEFENEKQKDGFEMPEFCLADVTQESFIAGGVLAGKNYSDIQSELDRFGYKPI